MKTKIKELICLLLLLSFAVFSVSCMRVRAAEISAGYKGSYESDEALPSGVYGGYAFLLFKNANKPGKNLLVSPLSALACTAMLCNGASGETLAQLERTLGCDAASLNKTAYAALSGLSSGRDHKIVSASSMWVSEGLDVKPDFLQKNADYIGAQVYSAKFDASVINDINTWAKQKTDGLIPKAIDYLPSDTVLVLINSLLFDMKWQNKYEKSDIKDGVFHNQNGAEKNVSYLKSEERLYFKDENTVGFAKYYLNNDYVFAGLLPDENVNIDEYISSFSAGKWEKLWQGKSADTVKAEMPEFDYDCETDLKELFISLGVTDLFDPGRADLSKISDQELYCSAFIQKTRIEHGRNGTKAAAITFGMVPKSAAPSELIVKLDRPFVYVIADAKTGMPVFVGAVKNL